MVTTETMDNDDDVEHLFSWLQTPELRYREFAGAREITDTVVAWQARANTAPSEATPVPARHNVQLHEEYPASQFPDQSQVLVEVEPEPRGPAMISPEPPSAAPATPGTGTRPFTLGPAGRSYARAPAEQPRSQPYLSPQTPAQPPAPPPSPPAIHAPAAPPPQAPVYRGAPPVAAPPAYAAAPLPRPAPSAVYQTVSPQPAAPAPTHPTAPPQPSAQAPVHQTAPPAPPASPLAQPASGLLGGAYKEGGSNGHGDAAAAAPAEPTVSPPAQQRGERSLDAVFGRLAGRNRLPDPRDRLRHIPGLGPPAGRPR